jgi:hypothetical protein
LSQININPRLPIPREFAPWPSEAEASKTRFMAQDQTSPEEREALRVYDSERFCYLARVAEQGQKRRELESLSVLDEYLERMRLEGKADAPGQKFSVDLEAQARKIARYQSDRPGLWLLKLVQAAVASGAPEVRIQLKKHTLEARFLPGEPGRPLELQGANQPVWVEHLRLALLAALSLQATALELRWGSQILHRQGEPDDYQGQEVRLWVRRRSRSFWPFRDAELASIHRSLAIHCAHCPIPIRLDARSLNLLQLESSPGILTFPGGRVMNETAATYTWLAERSWFSEGKGHFPLACPALRPSRILCLTRESLEPSGFWFSCQSCRHVLETDLSVHQHPLPGVAQDSSRIVLEVQYSTPPNQKNARFTGIGCLDSSDFALPQFSAPFPGIGLNLPAMACRRWLGLAALGQGPARIFYLRDGVLLEPVGAPSAFGATTAVIADSAVVTDLGQCKVVEDETVEADRQWLALEEERLFQLARSSVMGSSEGERLSLPMSIRTHWRKQLQLKPGL